MYRSFFLKPPSKINNLLDFFQLLTYVFEHNAMDLIMHYIDLSKNKDVRLAFEALKVGFNRQKKCI